MPRVSRFTVVPRLPERLKQLQDIARNLWWGWDPEAVDMFFRMDRDLWVGTNQNPVRMLGEMSQIRLEELAQDDSFLAHLDRVSIRLARYMAGSHWRERNPDFPQDFSVAYFSAEFGLHESVRIYSGGLGVLAGDHLKAASDLGLPLVGVGLLYREGYFSQYLNPEGWQQETYPRNDFYNMAISQVRDSDGKPIVIEVEYPTRMVKVYLWKCQVGRVPLYLLDCDHADNTPEDRFITGQLYGGDRETRIRQEVMLGQGGVIALRALGLKPTVFHMNEGHAAFLALQRIKEMVLDTDLSFDQAAEIVKAGSFFTTHTPVPAGNDMFDPGLIEHFFRKYCQDTGITLGHLLSLGRQNPADNREAFCMTVLALKLSAGANGVSKLHGEVARNMWNLTWRGVPEDEVPIGSITNGIHSRSFISRDLAELFDRYLGPGWVNQPDDQSIWQRIDEVPDTELWRTHERRRDRLIAFARRRLHIQLANRGAPASELRVANEVLDPEVLTIGFARRFATYKRATLLLKDPERLKRIMLDPKRPVQFFIAGKAHPQDTAGKQLIRDLLHFARVAECRHRFIFVEDYDINVARYMVQGVDCWLNTPRRPMEASGTSGMKAAANGALNISIPDGWWCEAENLGPNGWSIGKGESYDSIEEQDLVESQAFYDLLEQEVVPLFYDRGSDGLPRGWVRCMKSAIGTIGPVFNTYRMVQDYTDVGYLPCATRSQVLAADDGKRGIALSDWKQRVTAAWSQVSVAEIVSGPTEGLPVGSELTVTANLHLGELTHEDVSVELYFGDLDPQGQIPHGDVNVMAHKGDGENGAVVFEGTVPCEKTGQLGYTVRVVPSHPDMAQKHETCLIKWAE